MNRIRLVVVLLAVALLSIWAYQLRAKKGNRARLSEQALFNFAISDTALIDQIVLTDTEGSAGVQLIRGEDNRWSGANGECLQQHLVHTILTTIKRVKVKAPVPRSALATVTKNLAAHHRKVAIYASGKLAKIWYVGKPTPDQYGTYMLLKDPVKGKSPEPFIMYLPDMYGNLESRFATDPLEWVCTGVFNYAPQQIQSVMVTIPDSSAYNFKLEAVGNNLFSLYNNARAVEQFDTVKARNYLLGFRRIHFESHNSILDKRGVDSLKQTTPWYLIEVTDRSGAVNQVKCYKKKMRYQKYDYDGNLIEIDRDRLWVVTQEGELVVGQYYVFDKLLKDVRFFE